MIVKTCTACQAAYPWRDWVNHRPWPEVWPGCWCAECPDPRCRGTGTGPDPRLEPEPEKRQ